MPKSKEDIRSDLIRKAEITTSGVSKRKAAVLGRRQMTSEDALYVVAAQEGIPLHKYGLSADELNRVEEHISALGRFSGETGGAQVVGRSTDSKTQQADDQETPASKFNGRNFHPIVVQRSRRAFTTGQHHDAVLRAFKSVNNRVRNLTGSSKDGQDLMAHAFKTKDPLLTLSDRTNESEENEHEGTRFLLMGAIRAMRNPRAHEDDWPRDVDEAYVLDALSFASLLHRLLDIAEERL